MTRFNSRKAWCPSPNLQLRREESNTAVRLHTDMLLAFRRVRLTTRTHVDVCVPHKTLHSAIRTQKTAMSPRNDARLGCKDGCELDWGQRPSEDVVPMQPTEKARSNGKLLRRYERR